MRAGGGHNHRGSLSDAVLVKDNHLGGVTITEAVARARAVWPGRMVEVECDRMDQVDEAVGARATVVMLDNMTPDQVADVRGAGPQRGQADVLVEVSGGVTLETAPAYAAAGADLISVGALTHSAPVLDLGFDLAPSRDLGGLSMLLAIDVGNTETVVGLFADDLARPPPWRAGPLDAERAGRAGPPLAAVHRGRPHARRARAAPHPAARPRRPRHRRRRSPGSPSPRRSRWSPPTSGRWRPAGSTSLAWCSSPG